MKNEIVEELIKKFHKKPKFKNKKKNKFFNSHKKKLKSKFTKNDKPINKNENFQSHFSNNNFLFSKYKSKK